MNNLENEKCMVWFSRDRKEILGRDKTDMANEPRFYTRNRRGIEKAWIALTEAFNQDTTMYGAMSVLDDYKLNTHSYCAVD